MKTTWIKKTGLALIGMMLFGFTNATEPLIKIVGDKKVMVKLNNVSENTILVIKDLNGKAFYSEVIEKSNKDYSKIFNLSDFSDGKYAVEIEGDLKVESFAFNMFNNKIGSYDVVKTESFKPVVREIGNRVFISRYNPEDSYLDITVFDTHNQVVYTETLKGKTNLSRIYNFSKLSGEFKIAMSNGNRTYNQVVMIDK